MEYYYDILLNFEENYYMFYEWDKDDNIEYIKRIPIKHVDSKVIIDMLKNKIKVAKPFLKSIEDKTKLKNNKLLKYTCIFSDGKNALAIEFNDKGESINKSSILLEDEININEFMYNIDVIEVEYEVLEKEIRFMETRQDINIKKIIKLEIDNLYKNHINNKLKYLYLEWFNKLENNIDVIYNDMINKLQDNLTNKEYAIYELIKLSYNNV